MNVACVHDEHVDGAMLINEIWNCRPLVGYAFRQKELLALAYLSKLFQCSRYVPQG